MNGLRGATPNPDVMRRRMEFDLWYLNNWSIFLDLYIILKTFYALFKYKGIKFGMKVLHILNSLNYSGAEMMILNSKKGISKF